MGRELVGELLDVELLLTDEPVPEDIRGIALIKNRTQVIERLTGWGRKIPTELQDRLYGWATYYCTEDRPFLLVCEKPGHRGHGPHGYYRKAKELLHRQVEDFLLPYAKQQMRPKLTKKDRVRARQNLQIIRKALEQIPEFNPWSGEGMLSQPPEPKAPPEHPYISSLILDKEYYDYGDTAHAQVVILNPSATYQPFIHLTLEALDEGLSRLAIWELAPTDMPLLKPADDERKGRIETTFQVPISEDFGEGRNWLLCTLTNVPPPGSPKSKDDASSEELYDRKGHALWVETPPERKIRERRGGGSRGDDRKRGTLANLVPITAPLDPIEHEVIPMWSDAEIWFYTKGARIAGVYESDPRAADSILYELVAEAIADRIAELRLEEDVREKLDKTQILDEFRWLDELRKNFLRACERLRAEAA
ncbi:MAG: hypothetical protein ACE5IJ_05265 [Thermoplasmata archaeon]